MNVLAAFGFFQPKSIPASKLIPLAMGFVGYIVLCNVSLNINSVGFYQARVCVSVYVLCVCVCMCACVCVCVCVVCVCVCALLPVHMCFCLRI